MSRLGNRPHHRYQAMLRTVDLAELVDRCFQRTTAAYSDHHRLFFVQIAFHHLRPATASLRSISSGVSSSTGTTSHIDSP